MGIEKCKIVLNNSIPLTVYCFGERKVTIENNYVSPCYITKALK